MYLGYAIKEKKTPLIVINKREDSSSKWHTVNITAPDGQPLHVDVIEDPLAEDNIVELS